MDFSFSDECLEFYIARECDLLCDIHWAAYFLDPEFIDHKQTTLPECMEGLLAVIEKFYYDDEEMQVQATAEASCYKNRDGLLSHPAVFKAAMKMPGYRWSQMYMAQYPAVQRVQTGLLSVFASQSESERAHKANNEAKTKLRNRLHAGTTDKPVYVHCNEVRYSHHASTPLLYSHPPSPPLL